MIVGRRYLERGVPVEVLAQWRTGDRQMRERDRLGTLIPGAPRNVLVRRSDGTRVVRPFRGLRRCPGGS